MCLDRPYDIRFGVCRYLSIHPESSSLAVAHHIWAAACGKGLSLHLDSWIWIREQMEKLAKQGVLQRRQQAQAELWSLGRAAHLAAV